MSLSKSKNKAQAAPTEQSSLLRLLLITVGCILCAFLALLLVFNIIIIVKGAIFPDRPPSVAGTTPMVVLTGSMSGDAPDHIEPGDLIFVTKAEPKDIKKGDVIAFMQGTIVVSHRVIDIGTAKDGSIFWTTKGDANNVKDDAPVSEKSLVGIYTGTRIPRIGEYALFMQRPVGMLVFIGGPCLLLLLYDTIRRRRLAKIKAAEKEALAAAEPAPDPEKEALLAELAELRRQASERQAAEAAPAPAEEPAALETAEALDDLDEDFDLGNLDDLDDLDSLDGLDDLK